MENNKVYCPIVKRLIDDIECIVCRDVADKELKESCISAEFKINNFRDICKECEYHNY